MTIKHRITINLENDEYEALQKIAESSERCLAWLGRNAICEFVIQKGNSANQPHTTPTRVIELNKRAAK